MSTINFYAFQGIQDEQKAVEKFLEKIPQVNQKVTHILWRILLSVEALVSQSKKLESLFWIINSPLNDAEIRN